MSNNNCEKVGERKKKYSREVLGSTISSHKLDKVFYLFITKKRSHEKRKVIILLY